MTFLASPSPDATGGSADHFSTPAPPAARDTTTTDESTSETPTAPPPLPFHVPEDANDGALAASVSPNVVLGTDTDPVPAETAPPTAEHISSFLLHTRRRLADNATATSASTTPGPTASPFPDMTVDTAEGASATAAPATDAGMDVDVDTDATPSAAVGSTQDATGKKRRRNRNHTTRDLKRSRQRMAGPAAAHGGISGPNSHLDEGHSTRDER